MKRPWGEATPQQPPLPPRPYALLQRQFLFMQLHVAVLDVSSRVVCRGVIEKMSMPWFGSPLSWTVVLDDAMPGNGDRLAQRYAKIFD